VSENTHVKDWYVARTIMLDCENKRLTRELNVYKEKLSRAWYQPSLSFALGYFLACILWRFCP